MAKIKLGLHHLARLFLIQEFRFLFNTIGTHRTTRICEFINTCLGLFLVLNSLLYFKILFQSNMDIGTTGIEVCSFALGYIAKLRQSCGLVTVTNIFHCFDTTRILVLEEF